METNRSVSEGAENWIDNPIDVYDGFVYLVDYMGDDQSIVNAARRSLKPGQQEKLSSPVSLIRYLVRNRHTSPIEMVEMKFHLKMPIFVARQWMRHRMASINELSGRYSVLEDEFYIPSVEDINVQSTDNHQGRGKPVGKNTAMMAINYLQMDAKTAYAHYEKMLDEYDIAKEVARLNLPVNIYTEFYWKIDLWNLMNFMNLRLDDHAQLEIREYAGAVAWIVQDGWPEAYRAFEDYILNSVTFSAEELKALSCFIQEFDGDTLRNFLLDDLPTTDIKLSKREQAEFSAKLWSIYDLAC